MKLIFWVFAIFVAVGSLYGSLHMDIPYPFFVVVGIIFLIYRLSAKSAKKPGYRHDAYSEHMRMEELYKKRH